MPQLTYIRAADFAGIAAFINRVYNYPEFTETFTKSDFEKEFDFAHDVLIAHLSEVGDVAEGESAGDFSLYRYVDPNRRITVVIESEAGFSPLTIHAVVGALQEISEDYVVALDAHPSYVCVFKDGRVLGFNGASEDVLSKFGFS